MATIRLRGKRWQAIVNRKSLYKSKTFGNKLEALKWATEIESQVDAREGFKKSLYELHDSINPVSLDKILGNARSNPSGAGIYFLITDGIITYVGKSKNVISRLATHAANGRVFTHYFYLPCLDDELDTLEQEMIHRFNPSQNRAHASPQFLPVSDQYS